MKKIETELSGVLIIEPIVYSDNRGWFSETYNKNSFHNNAINVEFVQDNHSLSMQKGVLRGIHFQNEPFAQTKLVRCTKGRILDVAIDLRKSSQNYKKWIAVELSDENKKQLYIPQGFGHAFLTLTENCEVQYKVDNIYSKEYDRSIIYNDPDISIKWPLEDVILSEKDLKAPRLVDCDVNFK
jgi:dTDP-4-dehydrorhamnose reductase/dTDP-4-dehydrorhamnose 3,5-epimerase